MTFAKAIPPTRSKEPAMKKNAKAFSPLPKSVRTRMNRIVITDEIPMSRLIPGFFFHTASIFARPFCKPEIGWLICLLVTSQIVKNAATIPVDAPRRIEDNLI
jgi:hypothetical protein